ncbi:replication factor-A protein 1-related [Striga asiatica]|uniref:Replication factor-A protein 1-related n=1 Tax=Striga asiatica TaxID=4170 RepID=A0A5A7P9X5_STRAF|nr:replication factor-A protein 1-related [Striga asiatica]
MLVAMSRTYLSISQITDESRNWTALIQVVERAPIQTSKIDSQVLYRRYLFMDGEGTRVAAVVYKPAMEEFDGMLLLHKRYYLTGAKEEVPPQLPCQIEVHPFVDLHKYADTENPRSEFI